MRAAAVGGSLIVLLSTAPGAADAGNQESTAATTAPGTELHVKHRGGVNQAAADGTTLLHQAVNANDLAEVRRLIHAGANVNAANRYGVTPLSLAAANGNAPIVAALLTAGASPNAVSGEGEPVLMSAARSGDLAAVDMLLARGADPNARESWQAQTALMWAAAENHPEVVETLLRHGADPNASASTLGTGRWRHLNPRHPKSTHRRAAWRRCTTPPGKGRWMPSERWFRHPASTWT